MEEVSYDEAREWFWVRTAVWSAPAALLTAMACFALFGNIVGAFGARTASAIGVGVAAVLLGILAGLVSMQFPWMRAGWRRGFVLNGPACAIMAAVGAFLVCGTILSFMRDDTISQFTQPALYKAYLERIDIAYRVMSYGGGATALWGFIFGNWFSLRRDKIFRRTDLVCFIYHSAQIWTAAPYM